MKVKQVIDVIRGNYNDGVCDGNAEKRCCGKHCKVNGGFSDSFIVECVHKHHCCAVQWQEVSSPR